MACMHKMSSTDGLLYEDRDLRGNIVSIPPRGQLVLEEVSQVIHPLPRGFATLGDGWPEILLGQRDFFFRTRCTSSIIQPSLLTFLHPCRCLILLWRFACASAPFRAWQCMCSRCSVCPPHTLSCQAARSTCSVCPPHTLSCQVLCSTCSVWPPHTFSCHAVCSTCSVCSLHTF